MYTTLSTRGRLELLSVHQGAVTTPFSPPGGSHDSFLFAPAD